MAAMSALSPPRLPGPLRRALLIAAAVLTLGAAAGAARTPADTPQPHCGDPRSAQFPITSRLSGGPEVYARGGAPRTWQLELRNATAAECRAVHPVAVLADKGRALEPAHFHLDFYDPGSSRWLPVAFERTDEAENVGVLDGRSPGAADSAGFPGFVVPPNGAVTVPLRLTFTDKAPEGPVTANVTAVQKRGDDGAWVGESDDYTFAVEQVAPAPAARPEGTARSAPGAPATGRHDDDAPPVLADTGDSLPLAGLGATACALLAGGSALVLGARRLARRPR
ncbi:hypothetical protein [Streptomyces sp. NPDC053079]|uniref:hypothetical protein n=1 Tax=Streptomyces sp. NPDC053079 TaxID=3365697 RepID=UPI0037D0DDC5